MKKNIPDIVTGERQVKATVKKIAPDHSARYQWVAERIDSMSVLLDIGCGVGYGSYILGKVCGHVYAYDRAPEARLYWRKHYRLPNSTFIQTELQGYRFMEDANLAVCFEFIEHIAEPAAILTALTKRTSRLFLSVPNEQTNPFDPIGFPYHKRHYTVDQLAELLEACGWNLVNLWSQQSKFEPDILKGSDGKTLIAEAIHL